MKGKCSLVRIEVGKEKKGRDLRKKLKKEGK